MESANRAVPRGTLYIALQGEIQYVIYFLTYVAITRILTPPEVGLLPLLTATYSVFSAITLFALGTATTRFVAQYAGSADKGKVGGVTWAALKVVSVLSVSGLVIVALFSTQISQAIYGAGLPPIVLLSVVSAAVAINFATVFIAVLWGLNLFGQMVAANLMGVIVSRVLGILLATSPLRLEGYFIGWTIGNTLALLMAFGYARSHLRKTTEKVPVLGMLVYSYPILLGVLVSWVQQWADVSILYALTGSVIYTGVYYLGIAASNILGPIATSITSAVFPVLSSKYNLSQTESFKHNLLVAERALNVLVIPASFGLAAVAPTAVTVAYGKTYLAAAVPFAVLILSAIISAYQGLMSGVLQAIGKTQPLIRIASAGAIAEIVLTVLLVGPLKVTGSAIARLAMIVILMLVTYRYVRGDWWPSPDKHQLLKCLALSTVVGAVLFGFDSYLLTRVNIGSLVKLLLDVGVFAAVYFCGLWVVRPLHAEDVKLLKTAVPSFLRAPLTILEHGVAQD